MPTSVKSVICELDKKGTKKFINKKIGDRNIGGHDAEREQR